MTLMSRVLRTVMFDQLFKQKELNIKSLYDLKELYSLADNDNDENSINEI